MKKYKYFILLFLCLVVSVLTLVKSPDELVANLNFVASETKQIALIMHCVFLILLIIGLLVKKTRNVMFSLLILILSGLAMLLALKYRIIPNIVVFGTTFILAIAAMIKKELLFDIADVGTLGKIIGFISLAFAFYYLHWVETPIWKNALFYSPLGIINCPTLLAICGLLIFLKRPGLPMLEMYIALITLYFGFFGLMRLGATIDFILIFSSIYLLSRQMSKSENGSFYKEP